MNWETLKHIYRKVLIYKNTIRYDGDDRYTLTSYYPNGKKHLEIEYQNGQPHGKGIGWYKNGNKWWETEWQNGKRII